MVLTSASWCAISPSAPGNGLVCAVCAALSITLPASRTEVGHAPVLTRVQALPSALVVPPSTAPLTKAPATLLTGSPLSV